MLPCPCFHIKATSLLFATLLATACMPCTHSGEKHVLQSTAPASYFPDGAFGRTDAGKFSAMWYSKHLYAMGEPSLWDTQVPGAAEVYRFLWLRTFDAPIAVRVYLSRHDGSAQIEYKILSGQGGYEPGCLVKGRRRQLRGDEARFLRQEISGVAFWSLDPTGAEIGVDGAMWVLEGRTSNAYRVVERWSPQEGPVRALGLLFLKTAGLKIDGAVY